MEKTYGLARGSITYGRLWGRLSQPGVRYYTAETAEGLCQGRHGLTVRGAVPWKNTHVGSPKGEFTTHGHLAQHKGWPWAKHTSAGPGVWRSATPDCRGCGRNSNRVRRGNWTEKQQSARIRSVEGNGAASVIDTEQCSSVTGHLSRVHGRTRALHGDCKISQNVLGAAQPAALQMSAIEAPRANAQEEATPLVECALTPRGHGKCRAW